MKIGQMRTNVSWSKDQLNMLQALFGYHSVKMINDNSTGAISAIECIIKSLDEIKDAIIDGNIEG